MKGSMIVTTFDPPRGIIRGLFDIRSLKIGRIESYSQQLSN